MEVGCPVKDTLVASIDMVKHIHHKISMYKLILFLALEKSLQIDPDERLLWITEGRDLA